MFNPLAPLNTWTAKSEKKKFFLKAVFLISILIKSTCANAQNFIPKIGVAITNTTHIINGLNDQDPGEEFKVTPETGITFGLGYTSSIDKTLSFQTELNFIQKGVKSFKTGQYPTGAELTDFSSEIRYRLNYVELPVLVKVTLGRKVRFFTTAGVSVGMAIGGRIDTKTKFNGGNYSEDAWRYRSPIYFEEDDSSKSASRFMIDKKLDINIQVGAGVIISKLILLDVRYGYGLTSLTGGDYDLDNHLVQSISDTFAKSQNRVFQVTIGMPLKVKLSLR
jgi:hypothetical protein